ncbi:ChaN family lipoprotein [Billgrantia kenyensis]|uniref:ChaN family lipoprotein n=1 Tax=Billgrantia kenyensis TaxID=321266 RepID=A0A7V9W2F1_9GAMM|nr:ChaN family lipoprotein [Halomonas kenyensis]MBA2779820.1 ChaN family lipoprotein [Halomonas kenyensis]MCG6662221.1 PDZ domain-containing protein [Halomonas kenyensis]
MRYSFALSCRLTLLACLSLMAAALPAQADICPAPGEWYQPGGERLDSTALFGELAERDVVLLGEQHDRMDHHRWQLHTLAGLHAQRPDMVIGLEMLPREAQPALDAWVAGELDEAEFLAASNWRSAWGFDPALYLPILHFARLHRVPLKAINVTPELRGRLAGEGWEAVPDAERFGISPPAEALPAYRERLAEVYAQHPGAGDEVGLERFVAAQLVWDRAMAAGLAEATAEGALAVGLIGQGHLQYEHGVPHQLDDLGLEAHATLLPWAVEEECVAPPAGLAHAVFALAATPAEALPPMQLGVYIVPHEDGIEVHGILDGSVAERAGLEEGDIILRAAGEALGRPADLTRLVQRQPPGTLLPLEVRRNGEEREILARFPPRTGE